MDSIQNIIDRKDLNEPPEILALKNYVKLKYNESIGVHIRDKDIVLIVNNSSLANTLRLNSPQIMKDCKVEKRLTFRVV